MTHGAALRSLFARAVLCLFLTPLDAAGVPDLQSILDQHQMSVGSIRTLICNVEDRSTSRIKRVWTGQYYRSGQNVFIKFANDKLVSEALVKDGKVRGVTNVKDKNSSSKSGGGFRTDDGREYSRCDAWERGLIKILLPNDDKYLPFAQLVREASSVGKISEATLDGKQVVAVTMVLDKPGSNLDLKWDATVYFDPTANMMIVGTDHRTVTKDGRRLNRMSRVRDMREPKPGIFFPARVEATIQWGDEPVEPVRATTITGIRINEPVPDSTFALRYSEGLTVFDRDMNASYKVNDRGERITPPEMFQTGGKVNGGKNDVVVVRGAVTKAEQSSWTPWLAVGGVGCLLLAMAVKGLRAHRRRAGGIPTAK